MKLASFIHPQTSAKTVGLVNERGLIDLSRRLPDRCTDLAGLLRADALATLPQHPAEADFHFDEVTFLPVIEQPSKILCVGMNYLEKRIEFEQTVDAPTLFMREGDVVEVEIGGIGRLVNRIATPQPADGNQAPRPVPCAV